MSIKKVFFILFLVIGFFFIIGGAFFFINKMSKSNHIATFNLDKKLYAEKFDLYNWRNKSSGFYAEYITDSVNFRKYVGLYNDYSFFSYSIQCNNIIVKQIDKQDSGKIYKIDTLILKKLISEHIFE